MASETHMSAEQAQEIWDLYKDTTVPEMVHDQYVMTKDHPLYKVYQMNPEFYDSPLTEGEDGMYAMRKKDAEAILLRISRKLQEAADVLGIPRPPVLFPETAESLAAKEFEDSMTAWFRSEMPEATNAFLDALRNGTVDEARAKMMACTAYTRPDVLLYALNLVIHDIRDGAMLHMLLSAPRVRNRRVHLNQPLSDADTVFVNASGCRWMKRSASSHQYGDMPWTRVETPAKFYVSVLEDIFQADNFA